MARRHHSLSEAVIWLRREHMYLDYAAFIACVRLVSWQFGKSQKDVLSAVAVEIAHTADPRVENILRNYISGAH